MKYVVICAVQLKFWFQTDLGIGRKNSASYYRPGRQCFWLCTPWSRVGHVLRPILMLFLVKIWQVSSCGKFMQHLWTLFTLFTLTDEADRVLCQLVIFLTVFFHWMYKMKFSCYQEFSVIHGLVCLLGFWFRNTSLVKVGNPISDGIVFVFHLAWCVKRVEKSEAILALPDTFQELHLEW